MNSDSNSDDGFEFNFRNREVGGGADQAEDILARWLEDAYARDMRGAHDHDYDPDQDLQGPGILELMGFDEV
jgi:hypothetical protein